MNYIDLTQATDKDTTNYNELSNQPQINGVTLTGNKTTSDLGIQDTRILPDGYTINVATDGSGDFTDIQDALDSLENKICAGTVTIQLKAGDTFSISSVITLPNNFNSNILELKSSSTTKVNIEANNLGYAIVIPVYFKANLILSHLTIKANNILADSKAVFSNSNSSLVYITNTEVQKFANAFYAQQIANIKLESCTISDCTNGVSNQAGYIYINGLTATNVTTLLDVFAGGYTIARGTISKTNVTNLTGVTKNTVSDRGMILTNWN